VNGEVILYADNITKSMQMLISTTSERREKQIEYNEKHGIKPKTIEKAIKEGLEAYRRAKEIITEVSGETQEEHEIHELLADLEGEMELAARNLQFERAIVIREQIGQLRRMLPKDSEFRHPISDEPNKGKHERA
jgi:excinuclease ABC subunit B